MTTNASTAAQRSSRRRPWPWVALVAGLVVVALAVGAPDDDGGAPLDPDSSAPNGTKALVELLESYDAVVRTDLTVPSPDIDRALLLSDTLDAAATREVESWTGGGGVLVVADPFSSFAPEVERQTAQFGVAVPLDRDRCDVGALDDLDTIEPGNAVTFAVDASVRSCFGSEVDAYVVERLTGSGIVTSLGGAGLFTNQQLDEVDNAALAVRLLAPDPGTRVAILRPAEGEGSTERSLSDVMSTGVRLAIVQLFVAFVAYAWFRARRLGGPVVEPQPVEIAGSELVLAVGQLLQQAHDPNQAAARLRADLRRQLGERLGLAPGTRADVLADLVVARTGLDEHLARRALVDEPVADDDELLDLARTVEAVRQEVLHER